MKASPSPAPKPATAPARIAAPAPGQPEPLETEPMASRWLVVPGFLVLAGCLEAGNWVKARFGLILPGSILGLFLLLGLLAARVVPLRWVETAARLLLWLLPFLFIPIFIPTLSDRDLWSVQGLVIVGAVVLGTVLLWVVVGHISQAMFKRRMKDEG